MIVGTAGHIDHGKTTLVRALTGVDTDRLKEEKARGISIELGYAYLPLDDGDVLGFIDVPGHEQLVHTMAAGACAIDFALLVVAADDGVMPQTREHLAILSLFGVTAGAVALTKVDRVDVARATEVSEQVAAVLAPTPLRGAPVFQVNATVPSDAGAAALQSCIVQARPSRPRRAADGLFRLAVDRVFTLVGHGTIATGTVFGGEVRVGDTVRVMPRGLPARVRAIHAQNRPTDCGRAGERCALNLSGIEKAALSRGDWLADERLLVPAARMDVRLHLLADAPLKLRNRSSLHIHFGTTHRVARVALLESESVAPGEATRAQLVFDAPVCAVTGDRFIARDAQANHTVGGGVVLDPVAPARRRGVADRLRHLDALEQVIAGEGIEPLLRQPRFGVRLSDLARITGEAPERLRIPDGALSIDSGHERFIVAPHHWVALRVQTVAALRGFHERAPDEPGADPGRLRRIALPSIPENLWRALLEHLLEEGTIVRSGAWLRLPEHAAALSDRDETLARKLQPLIEAGRFDPPWVRDLAATVGESEQRVRQVLRQQARHGTLYQVVQDLFYDGARIAELANTLRSLALEHGGADAIHYRDAIGLGRKRAIQLLEFFDRVGYSRRVGNTHVPRADSSWQIQR